MMSPLKSPNMISTTGRIPVIAAPTASPVKPGSEIGVSRTRSLPNSSTSPVNTLKVVPASAISSPSINTVASRRNSSARASRMASPYVNSRLVGSGIDMFAHFFRGREGRLQGQFDGRLDLGLHGGLNLLEDPGICQVVFGQPV